METRPGNRTNAGGDANGVSRRPPVDSPDAGTATTAPPRPGWRHSLATYAGAGVLLLPVGTCPACFPAYAAVLSAVGLGFLLQRQYLLPLAGVLLAIALASLAHRARARRGYGPFVIGTLGAAVAAIGKFALHSDPLLYLGVSTLAVAATWNAWPYPASPSCARCAPQEAGATFTRAQRGEVQ